MIRKYQKQIKDSAFTSLVVGTILIIINHKDALFTVSFTASDLLHWSFNFFVPFMFSLYSRVSAVKKEKEHSKVIDV